jgi:general secretion pathway protein K
MKQPTRKIARPSERGFIIVAVLWILIALAALATIFSVYMSKSARALGATDVAVPTEALASASLELTAYRLLKVDEKERPAQGSFRFQMDNAQASVTFTSEASRVDLNKASKEMLANLFEVLGAQTKAAGEIADRIVGWRTEPKSNAANPANTADDSNATKDEASLYLAAGLTYSPRGGPFAHINELSLVLGISPALVERALPFVTVYSKSADVDVLLAAPEVVAAVPGMTPEALNDFLKQRASLPRDEKAIAAALGPAKDAAKLPEPKAFRVTTMIRFDNGRRASSEAVIALSDSSKDPGKNKDGDNKDPYKILSWQDQAETGSRPLRQAGR